MSELLALLAATAFALGTVLQQKGALQTEGSAGERGFLLQLFHRPVWLLGAASQGVGWVLQALALHVGPLVTVQALVTLSLVIALPLGAWLTDQQLTTQVWLGAAAIVAGIIIFLSAGSPEKGGSTADAWAWWSAGLGTLAAVVVLARAARTRTLGMQAVLYGAGAGLAFGFQAAVTKAFTDEVGQGLRAILRGWEVYALIGSAVVGFALQQSALKTGALAPAMAASNSMTLFASVALGMTVFGEVFRASGGRLLPVAFGLALALVGVVSLSRAPLMNASVPPMPKELSPHR